MIQSLKSQSLAPLASTRGHRCCSPRHASENAMGGGERQGELKGTNSMGQTEPNSQSFADFC